MCAYFGRHCFYTTIVILISIHSTKKLTNNVCFSDAYRIYIPSPTLPGNYCLAFHYHMFGFHIRELQVFRETNGDGQPETIWRKSKEQGNFWLFAQLTVNINIDEKVRQAFAAVYKKPFNMCPVNSARTFRQPSTQRRHFGAANLRVYWNRRDQMQRLH